MFLADMKCSLIKFHEWLGSKYQKGGTTCMGTPVQYLDLSVPWIPQL